MSIFNELLDHIPIPRMITVRQHFDRPRIDDLETVFLSRLSENDLLDKVREGMTIAVTAGSRGITDQQRMITLIVRELKKRGAKPFIVPAMGSHGGATAEGQKSMLEDMDISEETVGAPVRATMEVTRIGTSDNGLPVVIDKNAHEADGIVVFNRIKRHVSFRGPFESGLMKMITIGLGKQRGAELCHELGFGTMAENIPAIGRTSIEKSNILFAVGLIENAYHETCRIEVMPKEEIEIKEPPLLEEAKRLSSRLYFDNVDVLIMDEIGKDISGTGFDTNTVGRFHTPYASGGPRINKIVVLDLTEKSHGNANGLGIVDYTTRRVYEKFRFDQTYPNVLTSTVTHSGKLPVVLENDRHALQAAVRTCNILDKTKVRMVRVKNTLQLEEIAVSKTLLPEVEQHKNMQTVGGPYQLRFDSGGDLF